MIRYRRDLWKLFPKPGVAVEIGVAEGNFSEDMLRWKMETTTKKNKVWRTHAPVLTRLYMVDRWRTCPNQKGDASMPRIWHETNLAQVRRRVAPVGDRAVILRGDSVAMADEVSDGSLFLVYVDGDHSYDGVFRDIRAWAPKVMKGGYMAFHDFENANYGVKDAVQDFCASNFKIHLLPEDKPEDAGAYFQIC